MKFQFLQIFVIYLEVTTNLTIIKIRGYIVLASKKTFNVIMMLI